MPLLTPERARKTADAFLIFGVLSGLIRVGRAVFELLGDAQTAMEIAHHWTRIDHLVVYGVESLVGFFFSPTGNALTVVISGGYLWLDNRRHKRNMPVAQSRETMATQPVVTPQHRVTSPIPNLPTVVASAESSPRPVQPDEPVFVDLQPHELAAPFLTRLRAQAEQDVARYVGKHYRVTGPVASVSDFRDVWTVMLEIENPPTEVSVLGTTVILRFDQKWKPKIDLLNKGDIVSAMGEIQEIGWRSVEIRNCSFLS